MGGLGRRVLVAERATSDRAELCARLGGNGVAVVGEEPTREVESILTLFRPDLAVIEVVDDDPAGVVRWIRRVADIPIVLLVPPESPASVRIAALAAGAADVIEQPSDSEEVALRVIAILDRRSAGDLLHVHDVVIDEVGHMARRGDRVLDLTATEFRLLVALVRNAGAVLSKRQILSMVWGYDDYDVNLVEVHVSALRRKLEAHGPRIIDTVRAIGYVIRTRVPMQPAPTNGATRVSLETRRPSYQTVLQSAHRPSRRPSLQP